MRKGMCETRKQSENMISERKHDARYERFQCADRGPPTPTGWFPDSKCTELGRVDESQVGGWCALMK